MYIIDSIYETTGAFSMHVKDTNNIILMRGGEIDSVAYVEDVGELYNENVFCKILSHRLWQLLNASNGLEINGILFFEFEDKHVFIKLENIDISKSDYTFIPKESVTEIKGGLYRADNELLDSLN